MTNTTYQIKLPQFEGPFDLLLFFIERDELDIYNIPIHTIIQDFLNYLHGEASLNIELSSELNLFVGTLMCIKAKTNLSIQLFNTTIRWKAAGNTSCPLADRNVACPSKRYSKCARTGCRQFFCSFPCWSWCSLTI